MTDMIVRQATLTELTSVGETFFQSRMFSDVSSAAQAVVKVMAGAELGFPPFASMGGVAIIKGKPTVGANMIAAKIKASGKYTYRITEHTPEICTIAFFERSLDGKQWEPIGTHVFTMKEAQTAGLATNDNWRKYPKAMLFARCISAGGRVYCPDVCSGLYTGEELAPIGTPVNEDGQVMETRFQEEDDLSDLPGKARFMSMPGPEPEDGGSSPKPLISNPSPAASAPQPAQEAQSEGNFIKVRIDALEAWKAGMKAGKWEKVDLARLLMLEEVPTGIGAIFQHLTDENLGLLNHFMQNVSLPGEVAA